MGDERRERGLGVVARLFGKDLKPPLDDAFIAMTVDHVFGDVWTRPDLPIRDRSLATCAALVALGKERELKLHLKGALNVGIGAEALEELMIHVAHYAGWPAGLSGMAVLREVLKEQGQAPA